MNIAIIGYGKMGHEIEQIALQRGHKIPVIIDIDNSHELTVDNLKKCDVAIEFTTPKSAIDNIIICFDANIPVVSGTTGWTDKLNNVIDLCIKNNKTFFYASNFSLGVNIFFKLNKYLAELMNKFNQYEIYVEEIHHTQKLDAPSGTALTLVNDIISLIDRKNRWELNENSKDDVIGIKAIREGNIPGTHIITYDSDVDKLEIKHEAKNRKGFALGAVLAAEFIYGKIGYYTMDDLLKL